MISPYDKPEYYDIAFIFVNAKQQVDNFEKIIKKFSKRKVKRFLDIACGPSLQLREIAKRGYEAIGLDSNSRMLGYLKKKAKEEGVKIETIRADLTNFRLKKKADFAFIMMGSLNVQSNEEFLSHFDSAAKSLNKGGLYFIQNQGMDSKSGKQSWTRRKGGIKVKTTFEWIYKNPITQMGTERLTHEVNDHGKEMKFVHKRDLKFIYPQEFKTLVKLNGKFEFLGWWKGNCNIWHLDKPLEKAKKFSDNMVLLRRK